MLKKLIGNIDGRKALTYTAAACAAIAFYVLLTNLSAVGKLLGTILGYISPLITGAVIAYLLNPLANFCESRLFGRLKRRGLARVLGVVLTLLVVLAALGLLINAIVPQLAASAGVLVSNMSGYIASMREWVTSLDQRFDFLDLDPEMLIEPWSRIFESTVSWIQANVDNILGTSVRLGSSLFNFLISFVISVYILLDKTRLCGSLRRLFTALLSREAMARADDVSTRCHRLLIRYLGCNLLDSLIIGIANFVVMLLFNMHYALLISVIVGVTNFIPTFGPIIGAVPCALILLIVDPMDALWFVLLCLVLQTVDGNVLKPVLFGDSTGIAPLWVLVSIVIGGRMFGVAGMILGVPVFAMITMLIDEALEKREIKRGLRAPEHECEGPDDGSGSGE